MRDKFRPLQGLCADLDQGRRYFRKACHTSTIRGIDSGRYIWTPGTTACRVIFTPWAPFWIVYAGLRAIVGLIGVLFLHGLFGSHFGHSNFNLGWSPFGRTWLHSLWPMAIFSTLFSVGCTVLTGWALLTRQLWGRIPAIVFGIFALIHFPVGTALGIYIL